MRNRPGTLCRACTRVSLSSCLFPPSEGAQSRGALCSTCTRVSVSSCLLPPSEGARISRIFASPSEGVQSPWALCSACTRVFVSSCLLCNRPGPSVGPVRAFPFPAASSHLPKVCIFSAFSAHLPEVRTGMGCRITGCMYDFYTIFKKLDTCRMNFIQLSVFENCLSNCYTVICLIRHNFCNE